jgi:hypothetical protein
VPPSHQFHFAAFGFHLGDQCGLLFDGPFPPSLNPCNDLDVGQVRLLMELQKKLWVSGGRFGIIVAG